MSADASSTVLFGVVVEDVSTRDAIRAGERLGVDMLLYTAEDSPREVLDAIAAEYGLTVEIVGSLYSEPRVYAIGKVWSAADADTDAVVALTPRPRIGKRQRTALRSLARSLKTKPPRWWHTVVRT